MAFDIETTSNSGALTAVTGATFSHTVTNANKLLVQIAVGSTTQASRVPSSVTWNTSENCSSKGIQHETSGNGFETVALWNLDNPTATTANVVVTMAGTVEQLGCGVTGFTDANPTLGTFYSAQGLTANPAVTVVDSVSGNIVIGVHASDWGGNTLTEGGTLLWEMENVAADSNFGAEYKIAVGGSTSMNWTEATGGGGWAIAGIAVRTGLTPSKKINYQDFPKHPMRQYLNELKGR